MQRFGYSNLEAIFVSDEKKINYLVIGNLILFPYEDSLLFLGLCKKEKRKVLGIDGFRVIGDKIQPDQEHTSADFDNDNFEVAFEKAKKFLEERKSMGIWFEVVTDTDD